MAAFIGMDGLVQLGGRGERRLAGRSGQRGDADFEAFFDAIWPRGVQMVTRMGLNRQDAEDVVLDAMAVAYDRWAKVRELPYREGWLLKVSSNRALRQLKKTYRRGQSAPVLASSAEEEIAIRVSVREGIAGLPRRQREIIALRYLADMPEDEVAAVLGLNAGTVKQHASRGRAALRIFFEDEETWSDGHAT